MSESVGEVLEVTHEELEGSNVRPVPPEDEPDAGGRETEDEPSHEEPEEARAVLGLSRAGAAFIARFEGCVLRLYNDPVGHCTIGIGHLVHHGRCDGSESPELRQGITRERAYELLQEDAAGVAAAIRRHVKVPLDQAKFDALCSWAFNCGTGVLQTSTLVRRLNRRSYAVVPRELDKWVNAGSPPRPLAGLVRRRKAEGELFAHRKYE